MHRNYTTMGFLALALGATGAACGEGGGSGGGFAGEIEFEGQQAFLPGFELDTGFVPADSPAAIRVIARGEGGLVAKARATTDGSTLSPVVGSGELSQTGSILLEVSAKVDAAGVQYEGVVDSFAYEIAPATTMFEPFLLDSAATIDSSLPAAELGRVPIPSIPGAELIVDVTGGALVTTFEGACAETSDGAGQYKGTTTTSGTLEIAGTIEISIPIVGTETFGPFPTSVPIPELTGELDLGTRSLETGEVIEGVFPCDGGAAGTTGADSAEGGTSSAEDGQSGDSAATTVTSGSGSATDPTAADDTGPMESDSGDAACPQIDNEPNNTEAQAEVLIADAFACGLAANVMTGTLADPDDADWFVVASADTQAGGCFHDGAIDILGARVCIFADCAIPGDGFSYCVSGSYESSPSGSPGCCSNDASGTLVIECDSGASTAINAYVRVDQGNACEDYTAFYTTTPGEG